MTSGTTVSISVRIKTEVLEAVKAKAAESGVEPGVAIQRAIAHYVKDYLPEDLRQKLADEEAICDLAREKARALFAAGGFDEHFTRNVFREIVQDPSSRALYERVIGETYDTDGAQGKSPINMYLGWHIKNAVNAEPVLDASGKPVRAFVKGEPIKSYTLLKLA